MMNKIKTAMLMAQMKVANFFSKENGEVNIVAMVILLAIAIMLAVFFKNEITTLVQNLFSAMDTDSLLENPFESS
jgi:flagellin-like protein